MKFHKSTYLRTKYLRSSLMCKVDWFSDEEWWHVQLDGKEKDRRPFEWWEWLARKFGLRRRFKSIHFQQQLRLNPQMQLWVLKLSFWPSNMQNTGKICQIVTLIRRVYQTCRKLHHILKLFLPDFPNSYGL